MKWLVFALLPLLVMGSIAWERGRINSPQLDFFSQGTLNWTVPPSQVLRFGRFIFQSHPEQKNFSIRSEAGPLFLTTPPQQNFLSASETQMIESESHGSFDMKFLNRGRTCVIQDLQFVEVENEKLKILGRWICDDNEPIPWAVIFTGREGHLEIDIETDPQVTHLAFHFLRGSDEKVFGGGGQFSHFHLNNQFVPLWSSEQGIGRGVQPLTFLLNLISRSGGHEFSTYASAGQFVTNHNRAWVLHNHEFSALDLREPQLVHMHAFAPKIRMSWLKADSPKQLLEQTSQITGRMRALPDWAHRGAIVGVQGGSTRVKEKVESLLNSKAHVSAVWIQDWVGQRTTAIGKQLWWNWRLDSNHYQNWNEFRTWAESQQLALLGYWNPMLVDHSQVPDAPSLFKQAELSNFLVKDLDDQILMSPVTSFSAGWVDLTNPTARDWLKGIFKAQFLSLGFKGWMADFSEGLPSAVHLTDSEQRENHHHYIQEWITLNREIVDEQETPSEFLFFNRAGVTHSPRDSTLFWVGDQMTSWDSADGLASTLTALLSSGVSGMTLNHSDIGGYTSVDWPGLRHMRSEELLIRWMELNAFTVVFRSHEGNLPDESLQIYCTEKLRQAFAKNSQVFHQLFAYRKHLIKEAEAKGWPVVRPLWLEYPEWSEAWNITHQFMLGSDVLVAPVLQPGADTIEVHLPKGNWIHLFTRQQFSLPQPQKISIAAPLGTPAAFIRADSPWKDGILGIGRAIQ